MAVGGSYVTILFRSVAYIFSKRHLERGVLFIGGLKLVFRHPIKHPEDRKPTKSDLRYLQSATDTLMRLHMKVYGEEIMSLHTPKEWEILEETFHCAPKKQRVTLLLDEPVAKFFSHEGARLSGADQSGAELRLAKALEGPEDRGVNGEVI